MRINFFEEFPERGLERAVLVDFPSTVYLAARSLEEYRQRTAELAKINLGMDSGYWPILKKSYYTNPFAYPEELEGLLDEFRNMDNRKLTVMLDTEPPFNRVASIPENLWNVRKNNKTMGKIFRELETKNVEVLTAEYVPWDFISKIGLSVLGFSPSRKYKHKKMKMFYSSVFDETFGNRIKKYLIPEHRKHKENVQIALGAIAQGIYSEELLSPSDLERDLEFAASENFKNVTIFRLGGLDEDYLKVIRKYVR